jgi:hypothetical protein
MMRAASRRGAILAALAVGWAAAAGAQVEAVQLRPATGGQRLDWPRVLSLGDEARGQVGHAAGPVRDSHSRYIVATNALSSGRDPSAVPLQVAAVPVSPVAADCRSCGVELNRVVALRGTLRWRAGAATSVQRDARGRYYVATQSMRSSVLVFSPQGRPLRALGRQGTARGEFGWASALSIGPADSLHVLDVLLRRITVFAPDFAVARLDTLPGEYLWDHAILPDGRRLLNLYVATPEAAGMPLHLLASDGSITRSLGEPRGEVVRRDLRGSTARRLASSGGGRVWSARINAYLIEQWNLDGTLLRALFRQPEWFASWRRSVPIGPDSPPTTELIAIREDAAGLLWVLIRVADANWRASLQRYETGEGSFWEPGTLDGAYDTYVEVIDPTRQLVVASQRLPIALAGFLNNGLAFSEEVVAGRTQVVVWRLRAVVPSQGSLP